MWRAANDSGTGFPEFSTDCRRTDPPDIARPTPWDVIIWLNLAATTSPFGLTDYARRYLVDRFST